MKILIWDWRLPAADKRGFFFFFLFRKTQYLQYNMNATYTYNNAYLGPVHTSNFTWAEPNHLVRLM